MTEEQINIAIAESLEWKRDNRGLGWLSPSGEYTDPQNYTASLDACAEFEAKLTSDAARSEYVWYLNRVHPTVDIHSPDEYGQNYTKELQLEVFDIATCNPRHRCEAYLRVIGAWKEPNQQPE